MLITCRYNIVREHTGQKLPHRGNFALWGILYFFLNKSLEKLYLPKLAVIPATARPVSGHIDTATPVPRRPGWSGAGIRDGRRSGNYQQ